MKDFRALFEKYLNNYNQSWYSKDIEKLSEFYDVEHNELIYFDNHKGNDTFTLREHLQPVSEFFRNGKQTESGAVEEMIIEHINVFSTQDAACPFLSPIQEFPETGCNAVRNCYACKSGAARKRNISYFCYAVRITTIAIPEFDCLPVAER